MQKQELLDMMLLKANIDTRFDNIYHLLGIERPSLIVKKGGYCSQRQSSKTTKKTSEIHELETLGDLQSISQQKNLKDKLNATTRSMQPKIKRKNPLLSDRTRIFHKNSQHQINIDNKNIKYEKIVKNRKRMSEYLEKQKLNKSTIIRTKILSNDIITKMKTHVSKIYCSADKQQFQNEGYDKIRSKLIQKIISLRNI